MNEQQVKNSAESAIKLWQNNNLGAAFDPLYTGGLNLLDIKNEGSSWKSLAVLYAHLCAYLSGIAVNRIPPEVTLDPEIYSVPEPGMFLKHQDKFEKYYRPPVDLFILLQLLLYAEGINRKDAAGKIALNIYETYKDSFNLIKTGNNLISHLIISEKYREALQLSFKSTLYLFSLKIPEQEGSKKPESEAELKEILGSEGATFRQEIDKSILVFCLIPIFIKLGNTFLLDPETARLKAAETAEACLAIAVEAYQPELWKAAAGIISRSFNDGYSFEELLEMGDKFSREENYALKHLCLLAGTLQKGIIPENAIITHMVIFHEIIKNFMNFPYFIYGHIVVPFFKNYWSTKFSTNRFRFKNPSYVESELQKAFNAPNVKMVQKILYTVSTNLSINIDRSYIDSLKTSD